MKAIPYILFFLVIGLVVYLKYKLPEFKKEADLKVKSAAVPKPSVRKKEEARLTEKTDKTRLAGSGSPVGTEIAGNAEQPAAGPAAPKEPARSQPEPAISPQEQKWKALGELRRIAYRGPLDDPHWNDFWQNTFPSLPEEIKPQVYYEGCRIVPDLGKGGHHPFSAYPYAPFSFLGYPTDGEEWFGVAFVVNRACFEKKDVTLFYRDGDYAASKLPLRWKKDENWSHWPYWDGSWTGMVELIVRYSSGIGDVAVCSRYSPRERHPETYIRFRLDETKIKETVVIAGKEIPTKDFGGYAIVIPRLGEFALTLGEVENEALITLMCDDFIIK